MREVELFVDFLWILMAAIGFIVAIFGFVGLQQWTEPATAVVVMLAGVAAMVLAYRASKRRKQRIETVEHEKEEKLSSELTRKSWSQDRAWQVHTKSVVGLFISVGIFGVVISAVAWMQTPPLWISLFAGVIDLITVGLLIRILMEGIAPFAVFSVKGVKLPIWGLIPWPAVDGIGYHEVSHRGVVVQRVITFLVPDLAKHLSGAHPLARWLFLHMHLKKRIPRVQMLLSAKPVSPKVVEHVARFLWKQTTGKTHRWNPYGSDQYNAALKLQAEVTSRLAAMNSPEKLLQATPQQLDDEVAKLNAANAVITKQLKRWNRVQSGLAIITLVFFGIWLLAKLHDWS